MRRSSLNALPARESDRTPGCTHLRPNPDLVPARETRTASVPIWGTRMTMITTNPHVDHLILLQLPLRTIRGKRELGRTTIAPRRPSRCCLQGLLPLTLLMSLLRTTETSRPRWHAKVPKQPGNVYSDKHPTQIEKEIRKKRDWSKIVGEKLRSRGNKEPEAVPGPSSPPPERSPSPEGTSSGSGDDCQGHCPRSMRREVHTR